MAAEASSYDSPSDRTVGKIFDAIDRLTSIQSEQGGQIKVLGTELRTLHNDVGTLARSMEAFNKARQVSPSLIVSIIGSGVLALGVIVGGLVALMNYNIAATTNPVVSEVRALQDGAKETDARIDRVAAVVSVNSNTVAALAQYSASGLARVQTQLSANSQLRNQLTAFTQSQLCDIKQERTPGYHCPPYIYFPMIGADVSEPSILRPGVN